ncbi:uncharacterized protein ATNIH1004_009288 [Aspergillus tanneri]|nr:uncharacterized protein ATNIH1004_009288 [Aspergillus tanneri]KAA8645076.1 hypothetical protein ATNIH1004_009288 [Aspergillus tanneri]
MRRRLWWHLYVRDMRASEQQGTSPELFRVPFEPVRERLAVTKMTSANIRYETIRTVWHMQRDLKAARVFVAPTVGA